MIRLPGRRHLAALALLLLATPSLAGQGLPRERPEAVGMSTERLGRVRESLQRAVDRKEVAGAIALVVRDGRVVARDSAGVADLATGAPIRTDAIFRIASMTKPVTSVAAMMLVEEGKLALSDPVSQYIPAFAQMRVLVRDSAGGPAGYVPARRPITIRDLLTHRSGLTYGFLDRGPVGDAYRAAGVSDGIGGAEALTLAQNVERIAAQPLVHEPGSAYQYGLSTDVLGRVVEVASGQPLDQFFRTRIFEPLRMHDTYFWVPDDKVSRIAAMHTYREGEGLRSAGNAVRGSRLLSGGAGLFSTLDDYARFLQMLLNGGELEGVRLLGPKTVELMTVSHTNDLGAAVTGGGGFGLGFGVITDLGRTAAHGSLGTYNWGGIWGTTFWVDPVERLIGVGMIQLSGGNNRPFQSGFRTAAYQAILDANRRDSSDR